MAAQTTSRTISGLCDAYIKQHCEVDGISASQQFALNRIKEHLGALDVGDLTAQRCTEYRALRRKVVADGTIRRELGALRAVISWAIKTRAWPAGLPEPFIPLPPDSPARERHLTAKQEALVWKAASAAFLVENKRIGLFVCLALATAARASAIETLPWSRVDLKRRTIDFRDPNRRQTKKRRGVVAIADRLLPILEEAARRNKKRDVPSPWVLGSAGSTRTAYRTFMKGLGLPDVWRHDMRRTWATLAVQSGVDIYAVASVLADTVATTEKHYSRYAPDYLRDAVNRRPVKIAPAAAAAEARP